MFKTDGVTLSLVHYIFGSLESVKNGSLTNLETRHNNVVYATKITLSLLNILMSSNIPISQQVLLKLQLLFNVHSS